MNRAQFMEQLKKLLSDIPEEERREALEYYEGYFDEAGEDREAEVIRELGSPGKVAAIIKADLEESREDYSGYHGSRGSEEGGSYGNSTEADRREYTENGYHDSRTEEPLKTPAKRKGYHANRKINKASVILVLILLVFISPFLKGTLGGVIGVIVVIALLPFVLVIAAAAAVIILAVSGIALLFSGIGLCFSSLPAGVMSIGISLILLAVMLAMAVLLIWLATKVLPLMLRKFTDFCSNLLNKGRKKEKEGTEL